MSAGAAPPRTAVVIPAYQQPHFLAEAFHSAIGQGPDVRVVVVNDGSPDPLTDPEAARLCAAHPDRAVYLRQPNGGLSAARNTGIRFALDTWPSIDAVLPLDSDNVLRPGAIAGYRAALEREPGASFAYPVMELFGSENTVWWPGSTFSRYYQHFDNQTDAGCLVHRRVFDEGIWFDETMRRGFEDWELFLRACNRGHRFAFAGPVGFRYRKRGHSMLTGAEAVREQIFDDIRQRHRHEYDARRLSVLERAEMPRFALVDLDRGRATVIGDLAERGGALGEEIDLDELVRRTLGPEPAFVPPVVVALPHQAVEAMRLAGLLPLVLMQLLTAVGRRPVTIRLRIAPGAAIRSGFEPAPAADLREPSITGLAASSYTWRQLLHGRPLALGALSALVVELGRDHLRADRPDGADPTFEWPDLDLRPLAARRPDPGPPPLREHHHTVFARDHHVARLRTHLPYVPDGPGADVVFLVPWLLLGGVDLCVLKVAQALAVSGRARAHLVLTERTSIEADPALLRCFSTVTSVADLDGEARRRVLVGLVSGADLVVNAHSQAGYDHLADLRHSALGPMVSYLHLVDLTPAGFPAGYAVNVPRESEAQIQRFLVISKGLADRVANLGVPTHKICIGQNAPVLTPPPAGLLAAKLTRVVDVQRPLRVLYAGRLDRQKGLDRWAAIVAGARARGLPIEATVLGHEVYEGSTRDLDTAGVSVHPPVFDPAELSRWYEWADVYLLTSRYEGVPLALLDAMSYGCAVVATDVGAVPELVQHDRNGVLLPSAGGDAGVVEAGVEALARLAEDPDHLSALRTNAVKTSSARSWRDVADLLLEMLP